MSTKEKSGEEATDEDGDNSITTTQLQRPITLYKRKLGHAPRSVCIEEGGAQGSGGGNEPPHQVEDEFHADPLSGAEAACMTPARSVPDMDTDQTSTHVPYQPLDNSKRLPGQLSSQTASMASEGSQVRRTELDLHQNE